MTTIVAKENAMDEKTRMKMMNWEVPKGLDWVSGGGGGGGWYCCWYRICRAAVGLMMYRSALPPPLPPLPLPPPRPLPPPIPLPPLPPPLVSGTSPFNHGPKKPHKNLKPKSAALEISINFPMTATVRKGTTVTKQSARYEKRRMRVMSWKTPGGLSWVGGGGGCCW